MRIPVFIFRIYALLLLFSLGCKDSGNNSQRKDLTSAEMEETLLQANKHAVGTEDEQIRNFIQRYGWKMNETGTGLRYMIYKKGDGPIAKPGQIASLKYELRLITGDVIYSSNEKGLKKFLIGKGGVESGLEEAILFLHLGDKAKIILPSHLAYGLIGDQDRIPGKSTLIYDVELINLK